MNSMSKGYYNDDCDHCKKEKKHCPTILRCGQVGRSVTVTPGITQANPSPLATVAVNIPKGCNPCSKIEFASTVTFTLPVAAVPANAITSFTVTIFRNCTNFNNCGTTSRIPVGSYDYSRTITTTGAAAAGDITGYTDTFSFFVCDCNICQSECCYYSAEITSSSNQAAGSAIIDSPALAALVVSSDCDC